MRSNAATRDFNATSSYRKRGAQKAGSFCSGEISDGCSVPSKIGLLGVGAAGVDGGLLRLNEFAVKPLLQHGLNGLHTFNQRQRFAGC